MGGGGVGFCVCVEGLASHIDFCSEYAPLLGPVAWNILDESFQKKEVSTVLAWPAVQSSCHLSSGQPPFNMLLSNRPLLLSLLSDSCTMMCQCMFLKLVSFMHVILLWSFKRMFEEQFSYCRVDALKVLNSKLLLCTEFSLCTLTFFRFLSYKWLGRICERWRFEGSYWQIAYLFAHHFFIALLHNKKPTKYSWGDVSWDCDGAQLMGWLRAPPVITTETVMGHSWCGDQGLLLWLQLRLRWDTADVEIKGFSCDYSWDCDGTQLVWRLRAPPVITTETAMGHSWCGD